MTNKVLSILEKAWFVALVPLIAGLWDSLWWLRIFVLLLCTIIVVAWWKREWLLSLALRPQYRERDKTVFVESEKIFSLQDWRDFEYCLLMRRGYDAEDAQSMREYIEFLDAAENRYLLAPLRSSSDALVAAMDKLDDFVALHFFLERDGSFRFEPGLKMISSGETLKAYYRLFDQMKELALSTDRCRAEYQQTVNRRIPEARALVSSDL